MSIDSPPIPPVEEPKKRSNLLLGCLIALVLILVVLCCAISLVLMPLFTDFDPLGTGLRDRIEEYLPLDYLEEPTYVPTVEVLTEEESCPEEEEFVPEPTSPGVPTAEDIPLAIFDFVDIRTSFYYPVGWDIEMEGYGVTFYEPDSYTYIYMGEDLTELGTTAEEIALDILASIEEEAQEDSFSLITSDPYYVNIADDAYLTLFEWVDQDGYYAWAYDLEIVSGESNIYIFLSGEDPDEILYYGDLLDMIASSLESAPEVETSNDA